MEQCEELIHAKEECQYIEYGATPHPPGISEVELKSRLKKIKTNNQNKVEIFHQNGVIVDIKIKGDVRVIVREYGETEDFYVGDGEKTEWFEDARGKYVEWEIK